MSKWKITYRGIIYPWHCYHMGHMNVMWYAGKFDEACWQLLAMLGLERSRFARDGTGMAAVEQHIQYKRELHAGDAVTIQSALLEVKDKSVRMLHKMVHDASGEVAATTVVVGIHIDASLRKAIRLPEDVRQRAVKMKERETPVFQEIREWDANQPEGTESSDCSR
jgi:acyl-CoA thioester hydrolase